MVVLYNLYASHTRHSPDKKVRPMRRDAGIEQRAQSMFEATVEPLLTHTPPLQL